MNAITNVYPLKSGITSLNYTAAIAYAKTLPDNLIRVAKLISEEIVTDPLHFDISDIRDGNTLLEQQLHEAHSWPDTIRKFRLSKPDVIKRQIIRSINYIEQSIKLSTKKHTDLDVPFFRIIGTSLVAKGEFLCPGDSPMDILCASGVAEVLGIEMKSPEIVSNMYEIVEILGYKSINQDTLLGILEGKLTAEQIKSAKNKLTPDDRMEKHIVANVELV